MRHRSIPTSVERIALLAALLLAICPPAAAADRPNPLAAKQSFEEAERFYQLGRFEEAITSYERAYALDRQPAFLLNIALAHRRQFEIDSRVERLRMARELYRNYLRLEPNSARRPGVERLIDDLSARLEREPAPPVSAPVAPALRAPAQPARSGGTSFDSALVTKPAPTEPPRSTVGWWIAGGVVVAAATVLGVLLTRDRSAPTDGPTVNLGGVPR